MNNIKKIFAENIKRFRKNRKLTQEQFAELIGVQWKSVVNFETGRNIANSENLQNICNKLNIEPYELFIQTNSKTDTKDKINLLLQSMDNKKIEEIYRIIAVIKDKNHFCE